MAVHAIYRGLTARVQWRFYSAAIGYLATAGGHAIYDDNVPPGWPGGEETLPSGEIIALVRRGEFAPATGAPTTWLPAARYNHGTSLATQSLGWGEVLSVEMGHRAPNGAIYTALSQLIGGWVGDPAETLSARVAVELLREDDQPEAGDEFWYRGRMWVVTERNIEEQQGASMVMTVVAAHWPNCYTRRTPPDFPSPGELRA